MSGASAVSVSASCAPFAFQGYPHPPRAAGRFLLNSLQLEPSFPAAQPCSKQRRSTSRGRLKCAVPRAKYDVFRVTIQYLMNASHIRFVQEYLIDRNGAAAATVSYTHL